MKCTAMAALVFKLAAWPGAGNGAAPAEKPEKARPDWDSATAAAVDAGGSRDRSVCPEGH